MKHLIMTIMAAMLLLGNAAAQTDADSCVAKPPQPIVLPGEGHINVEALLNIDCDMDISRLSLAELRVLRNALAARQGYCFESADLRCLFASTTWYDSLMLARWERVEDSFEQHPVDWASVGDEDYRVTYSHQHDRYVPLSYSAAEQRFIERLRRREGELARLNFATTGTNRVNVDNILNPWQLEEFPEPLRAALGRNGFAIVPGEADQLFHIYEKNDYSVFPSFVTTDVYLQLFHLYFDCIVRDIEVHRLDSCLGELCGRLAATVAALSARPANKQVASAAEWLQAYLAVAQTLHGTTPTAVPQRYAADVAAEVGSAERAENALSPFLGYNSVPFAYALFRPRGHYAASERLKRYFRTMMWLQTAPFATDDAWQMQRAVLLAHALRADTATTALYRRITEPLTYLLGAPDNVGIDQLADVVAATGMDATRIVASRRAMRDVTRRIEAIAEAQTRIRPKHLLTARHKLNLMPQRYMPDAEVMQEMADTDTRPTTRRKAPRALDVMAAMGVDAARHTLIDELREAERWPLFPARLDSMCRRMGAIDWHQTVANSWMDALRELHTQPATAHTPYFMATPAWQKKSLNTALASYAELKHDAILYAKQPFGAECGGGGPPEPVTKGYVEPSLSFWQKAVELNSRMEDVLTRFGLMTDKAQTASESIGTLAQFLLGVCQKELAGQPLSYNENDQIETIGSTIEYISLDLVRRDEQYLMNWNDVDGADRSMACVADVYTANALNVPDAEKAVLYEAVGPASEIYVVVELGGQLWLTRGAVFSYREFERPVDQPRLTDEEWRDMLQRNPDMGTPTWMHDIIVPLGKRPAPNVELLYSSGC